MKWLVCMSRKENWHNGFSNPDLSDLANPLVRELYHQHIGHLCFFNPDLSDLASPLVPELYHHHIGPTSVFLEKNSDIKLI